jgi:hypothetical protein
MRVQRRRIKIKRRFEYGSGLDFDSIESANPDSKSGSGSRPEKLDPPKKEKKISCLKNSSKGLRLFLKSELPF